MRYIKHSIIRTGSLLLLIALAISVIAGCSGSSSHASASATPTASNSNTAHASDTRTTVLQLHDGAMLVIPAGAMTDGATVTATYTSPPKNDQTDQAPIGPQVHFSVEPANAIRHPLLLEFPLPSDAFPVAARYGAYSVATFDSSSHLWVDVASAYDPNSNMLVTNVSHFSWWTTVKQAAHYALIVAKCIPSAVVNGVTSTSWSVVARTFLTCLVKAEVSDISSGLAERFLKSITPQDCWSALIIDGLLAGRAAPAVVLKGIFTEPACTGHAGETVPPATVTAVSPSSGSTSGGNTISITGTLFQLANQVLMGGTPAHFSIATNSNSSITATVPAHAAGTVDVRVVTGGGSSATSSADHYTYVPSTPSSPPTVTPITHTPPTSPPSSTAPYETAGGVAHTWTNYMNAGGTEGPSVAKYQTVRMSCRITGFKVADGNTWWYRIASSPWNSVYYVSADAFYNNGQTSGSLVGTPWVDTNVPICSGSPQPPTPTPAPHAWSETAGPPSGSGTFTDYTNAGGTLGQRVAAYQTIQVTCRLTGFKVADGNTWWYKIASSPWNNTFYAPADNFYNNGATSGSLSGTPFVDTNVPMC